MKSTTIKHLVDLNNNFYHKVAVSFDSTRQSPWPGWFELLPLLSPFEPLTIADLGSGNGRFFKFLADHTINITKGYGFDSSKSLLQVAQQNNYSNIEYHEVDLLQNLPSLPIKLPEVNVITSFGMWHHIPGRDNRKQLLFNMLEAVKKPGIVIVSLWHVTHKKTIQSSIEDLETGDVFIGWQNHPDAVRYCHQFDESEIEDLMALPAATVGRFEADGQDGKSNTYLYYIVR